jgi:hypothetical protein
VGIELTSIMARFLHLRERFAKELPLVEAEADHCGRCPLYRDAVTKLLDQPRTPEQELLDAARVFNEALQRYSLIRRGEGG